MVAKQIVDIIILSYCYNRDIYQMNMNCLQSLFDSESDFEFKVTIIESNKKFHSEFENYPFINIEILIPVEKFHFNKFLNIGIRHTKNRFIALCNNDLVFAPKWFTAIHRVSLLNSNILSFCPVNPGYNEPNDKPKSGYILGHTMRKEIVGNCILVKREVFDVIGLLDENFEYYLQDDDYGMCLRQFSIQHALVTDCLVHHIFSQSSKDFPEFHFDVRIEKDRQVFHKKWGSQRTIAWKNRIVSALQFFKLNHRRLQKFIYGNFNY